MLPTHLAAVDLGSNSFHLAVARVVGRELTIIDRVQERVQLAAGLTEADLLDETTQERALACIERFGQRLRDTPGAAVRAVGTDALRVARNARALLDRAASLLGHPIEVMSGDEEARLTYRGVAQAVPHGDGQRQLVIDIGGGSTECMLGVGLEPELTASLHMGCVGFTKLFFPDGQITRERFRRAQIAAQLNFERLPSRFLHADWARAWGSSGTMVALEEILRANGWTDPSRGGITRDGLTKLREALVAAGHVDRLGAVPGLKPQRVGVIAAGLAIARAAFKALPLKSIATTTAALREGILDDLLGRFLAHDIRESTIHHVQARFHADRAQAERVEQTALRLFESSRWIEGGAEEIERARRYLAWASRLHEIGLAISFHGYHKHGAYILANIALPGFSRDDTQLLSVVVGAHRKRVSRDLFVDLPRHLREHAFRLTVLLRLAARLERSPSERAPSAISLEANQRALALRLPEGFLAGHPLTQADLDEEVTRLAAAGLTLVVRS
ncbi:MAG: Ppx/GppA family phosphatase [Deltaproteobacteria bacterium]|nr:Ppx/GppA family phosphatase [Deltaproteobacteria bacterium]